MFVYEHRSQEPLSRRRFLRRMVRHGVVAAAVVAGSLAIGAWGYHRFGELPWVDAFMNAAMLLGGMGQVGEVSPVSGKLFAGLYALYAGVVFLLLAATLLTPIFHRVLHRFHWDADRRRSAGGDPKRE